MDFVLSGSFKVSSGSCGGLDATREHLSIECTLDCSCGITKHERIAQIYLGSMA